MPDLGKKYTCYSCHTKFYDLGKPVPLCPKCGSDQRDAEEQPVVPVGRGRRVVEEPVEDDFVPEATPVAAGEEEEEEIESEREEDLDDDDEEEY